MSIKINTAQPGSFFFVPDEDCVFYRCFDGQFVSEYSGKINIYEDFDHDDFPEIVYLPRVNVKLSDIDDDGTFFLYNNNKLHTVYEQSPDGNKSLTTITNTVTDKEEDVSASTIVVTYDQKFLENTKERKVMGTSVAPVVNNLFNTEDFFRVVDRCVYDFRSGNLGVKKTDGKGFSTFVPSSTPKGKPTVKNCELKEFGTGLPAVAVRTQINDLKPGDMVIIKDNSAAENWLYYLSTDKEGDTTNFEISGIETDTGKKVSISVQDGMLLAGDAVLCVKNFLGDKKAMKNMLPMLMLMGNQNGGGNNNALMAMMMMGGGGEGGMSDMLPMLLLSQGQNGGGGIDQNTLMMMMMMGKGGDMKSMLPMLLLSQGQNSGAGINPLVLMMMMGEDSPFKSAVTPVTGETKE